MVVLGKNKNRKVTAAELILANVTPKEVLDNGWEVGMDVSRDHFVNSVPSDGCRRVLTLEVWCWKLLNNQRIAIYRRNPRRPVKLDRLPFGLGIGSDSGRGIKSAKRNNK